MSGNIKTILILSLALNLLLAGLIGGHIAKRGWDRPEMKVTEFPLEKQDAMRAWWKGTREANKKDREAMDVARQQVLETLTAPDFDATRYAAQSAKLNELRNKMMMRMSRELGSVAKTLNSDERMLLARSLRLDKKPPMGK